MKVTQTEQTITPAWAKEVLDRHFMRIEQGKFLQRPVSERHTQKYISDMTNGAWLLSPVPISFDDNNDLIDGQHRLIAVVKSGKSIRAFVSTGWPADKKDGISTIDVIDAGKPRSVAALMHMQGYKSASNYASSVSHMARVAVGGGSAVMGIHQAIHFLDKEGMKEHIDRIIGLANSTRDFLGRVVGPLAYYHTVRPAKARAFAEGIFRFEVEPGSAVQAFLNWQKNRSQPPSEIRLRALCAAIRAWDEGREVGAIKPTVEAVQWLANQNPKLKAVFREMCPPPRK